MHGKSDHSIRSGFLYPEIIVDPPGHIPKFNVVLK
jgi:hypothetical protein